METEEALERRPFREILSELREMRRLLEEIKQRLAVVPPPVPPVVRPPPAPPEWMPVTDRLDKIFEELGVVSKDLKEVKAKLAPILLRANAYHVEPLDLGTERTDTEFIALEGFALTIFKCSGTIGLKFNAKSEDKITIDALTYPQTLLIDWFDFTKVYVTNTTQSGKSATLISWKRELT